MSPTIVLDDGVPVLAIGSPGGSMIITTVTQTLINRLDFGMPLLDAVAAPRASQRNTAAVSAEPAFITPGDRRWGARSQFHQRGGNRGRHGDRTAEERSAGRRR